MLNDIITYIRRIIKSPSNADITDSLLIDYINRFWINDVDARIQLFDLKTTYQFQTTPGVDQYNMPLYSVQPSPLDTTALQSSIGSFPVYQGFVGPAFINGINVPFYTQRSLFNNMWPTFSQNVVQVALGNDSAGPYTFKVPFLPSVPNPPIPPFNGLSSCILRGHIDTTGLIAAINAGEPNVDPPIVSDFLYNNVTQQSIVPVMNRFPAVYFTSVDATGANVVIADSGQFLTGSVNNGLLMTPGAAPFGDQPLQNGGLLPGGPYSTTQNTINYFNGVAENIYFPVAIPSNQPIQVSCFFYQLGIPRAILYYNNTLTLRSPPNTQYLVDLEAYLTPAAFLNTAQSIPFGYMAEYIARGASRKILSDTGDVEQFNFYEPFFREQEILVWKRSQRQWTSTRTQTIYSQNGLGQGNYSGGNSGIGTT